MLWCWIAWWTIFTCLFMFISKASLIGVNPRSTQLLRNINPFSLVSLLHKGVARQHWRSFCVHCSLRMARTVCQYRLMTFTYEETIKILWLLGTVFFPSIPCCTLYYTLSTIPSHPLTHRFRGRVFFSSIPCRVPSCTLANISSRPLISSHTNSITQLVDTIPIPCWNSVVTRVVMTCLWC